MRKAKFSILESDERFASLIQLLLSMSHVRSLKELFKKIILTGEAFADVALIRIYLLGPGDICDECPQRSVCPDQTQCLHAAATGGNPLHDPEQLLAKQEDPYRRIPLGAYHVGKAAQAQESVVVRRKETQDWVADEAWAEREQIRGIVVHPLLYRDELQGVVCVYNRREPEEDGIVLGRIVANQLAASIANARAFEEIEALRQQLKWENEFLRQDLVFEGTYGEMIGKSHAFLAMQEQIDLVAPTDATVLIQGESGTGKELIAREIHRRGQRQEGPMIKVNCGAIPPDLYESEFFGHAKGAFTGAIRDRAGRFEAADGGTLFLDEVGEIPPFLQSKLLRVLQEGTYERVGEERTRQVDVRIVTATNRDLKKEMAENRFRQDLYYRLSVFPIEIAPLRERKDDIPLLAVHFLDRACEKMHVPKIRLTRENVRDLQRYDWPGNIRELQNSIERAVIMARHYGRLQFDIPDHGILASGDGPAGSKYAASKEGPVLTDEEVRQLERDNILRALQQSKGKIRGPAGAAKLLGVKPTTLAARIRSMGIELPSKR